VLEKDEEDQLDRSCEKYRILHRVTEERNIVHNKKKGRLIGRSYVA